MGYPFPRGPVSLCLVVVVAPPAQRDHMVGVIVFWAKAPPLCLQVCAQVGLVSATPQETGLQITEGKFTFSYKEISCDVQCLNS